MTDLDKLKLRGSVRSLTTEFAELDLLTSDWQPPKRRSVTTFRPDGNIATQAHHNPDGSVPTATYSYDSAGRLEEVRWTSSPDGVATSRRYEYDQRGRLTQSAFTGPDGLPRDVQTCTYDGDNRKTATQSLLSSPSGSVSYGVEGSEHFYDAPGAVDMRTRYDDHERPVEVIFSDRDGHPVCRVVFTRDAAGRVVREVLQFGSPVPPDFREALEKADPAEQERMKAMLAAVFGSEGTFSSITYTYDADGRLAECHRRMGTLSEERVTYAYDEHGNRIEEASEETSRSIDADESGTGTVSTTEEPPRRHTVRFDYRYDEHGNWTERVVSSRHDPDRHFHRSNVERRIITYFAS